MGVYCNLGIINLNYTVSFIKIGLLLIKKNFLLNNKLLIINEGFTQLRSKGLSWRTRQLGKYHFYFVFERWVNGLLTNMRNILGNSSKKIQFSQRIYLNDIPSLVLVLNTKELSRNYIFKEIHNLNLISIKIINGSDNPRRYPYWIPGNTQSRYSQQFYLTLILVFLNKLLVIKHKLFFNRIIKIIKECGIEIN